MRDGSLRRSSTRPSTTTVSSGRSGGSRARGTSTRRRGGGAVHFPRVRPGMHRAQDGRGGALPPGLLPGTGAVPDAHVRQLRRAQSGAFQPGAYLGTPKSKAPRRTVDISAGLWQRHSHVAALLSDRHSLEYVKRRLGHESIKTTSDRYGHLLREAHEGALRWRRRWRSAGLLPAPPAGRSHPGPRALSGPGRTVESSNGMRRATRTHVTRPVPAWKPGVGRTHVQGQAAMVQQSPVQGQASAHCSSSAAH